MPLFALTAVVVEDEREMETTSNMTKSLLSPDPKTALYSSSDNTFTPIPIYDNNNYLNTPTNITPLAENISIHTDNTTDSSSTTHYTLHGVTSFILSKLAECTPGGSKWRHLLIIPAFVYLIIYALFPQIPNSEKYPINVSYLVSAESTLFGGYLPFEILNRMDNPYFDVLCAIPYTLHIPLPLIFILIALIWQRDAVLPFLHCIGIASLVGVIVQFVFPTAPPWYFAKYGESPANYDMRGDPAGLARVDTLFGSNFYHEMFEQSTIVFGAFPSLHVTWATLICLFICSFTNCCKGCAEGKFFKAPWKCPKWIPPLYVIWLSFAVVYLEHHFVIDVIGGLVLAFTTKYIVTGPRWVMCGRTINCTPRGLIQCIHSKRKDYQNSKNSQAILLENFHYEEQWDEEEGGGVGLPSENPSSTDQPLERL
eukprot:TRINITY_DN5024_c0_g1_i1.p1 TRINITY_DN5024_c0_g1~~TRINITY_DN5024_c0_g1_i1.p1  ORF type:complete len:425 (-),score=43.28 TRINITY_DN5024_c0_g1_i1:150-1424(-)